MAVSILDEVSSRLVADAQEIARRAGHRSLDSRHVFYQLICQTEEAQQWMRAAGCSDPTTLATRLLQQLSNEYGSEGQYADPTLRYIQVMRQAGYLAEQRGAVEIQPHHLLEAIVTVDDVCLAWLHEEGLSPRDFTSRPATPLIDQLCRDLTGLARQGKLPPVLGRTAEMQHLIEALLSPGKNNALLLGEAGVGKTAVVELLAQNIVNGNVPQRLRNRRLFEVNTATLVAGTSYRGQFEARVQALLDEIEREPEAILVVDEFHTVIGTGSVSEGGTTLGNIFKPALARGRFTCIGATTWSEYRRYVEKDSALVRRFRLISVPEPTPAETEEMLALHLWHIQRERSVQVTDGVLRTIVELAERYLPARHFPDKAVDVLAQAVARSELQGGTVIDGDLIAGIVSQIAGVPIGTITQDLRRRLVHLEQDLSTVVVGQEQAVQILADALRVAWTGLRDLRRPRGVYLFTGPSGVGKTSLARALAVFLFGSEKALIRLDMSEYMEWINISRLIGAAPGYIGHDEPGQLTDALLKHPHSVVLLDEIEKAHPQVLDLFLQLFDEGRLTDARGRTVDGRHAVFIMTSNAIQEWQEVDSRIIQRSSVVADSQMAEQAVLNATLSPFFRTEFLNRIDRIIPFHTLKRADLARIAQKEIDRLGEYLHQQGLALVTDPAVPVLIADRSLMGRGGARQIQEMIEEQISVPLSKSLLSAESSSMKGIRLLVNNDHIEVETF